MEQRLPDTPLPRIVVIGGGFGGLKFAKKISPEIAHVTIVDRQNHHLFQPLLYQVATAALSAVDIAQPIRGVFDGRPNLEVVMADVSRIDLEAKRVFHSRGELEYDYLVIAAGSGTSYFGHPEWEEFAPGLKTLDDALKIRRVVLSSLERAETETDPNRRMALMTAVVIGGGPTGVELAGALADLTRTVLHRDFDRIDLTRSRILLLEGGPRVLPTFTPDLSASAQRQLEALGVEVRTGTMVRDIRNGEVEIPGETIQAGTIIWAAGVGGSPLAKQLGVETDRGGRLKVLEDLSLRGQPHVFAIGDIVSLKDVNGVIVPGVAPAAMQMAQHVARTITAELRNRRAASVGRAGFAYRDKGMLATIGRGSAVAAIGGKHFGGRPAWLAWMFIHLAFLIGFRNRLSVMVQWVYAYVVNRRSARIITGAANNDPTDTNEQRARAAA